MSASGPVQTPIESRTAKAPLPSAARRAYDIIDIRLHIIQLLRKSDQAVFLRVEKAGHPLVAGELYRKTGYDRAQSLLKEKNDRQKTYVDSVRVIDSTVHQKVTLSPEQDRILEGINPESEEKPSDWLEKFYPEVLNVLPFGYNAWTVHLPDDKSPSPSQLGFNPTVGHIVHFHTVSHNLSDEPPTFIPAQISPTEDYTVEERFDLHIHDRRYLRDAEPLPTDKWLNTLRNADWLCDLYRSINTGPIPVEMNDILSLFEKQASKGHKVRLDVIIAEYILPYDIDDFHRLAITSLRSLTVIKLFDWEKGDHREDEIKLTFKDFPRFLHIIKHDLPCLTHLHIALGGISFAEEACRSILTEDTLDQRGSLQLITMVTAPLPSFPFNLLRAISTICLPISSMDSISICPRREIGRDDHQLLFVRYLRNQSKRRRTHLAKVDFATLDVVTESDARRLTYDDEDRPRRIGVAKAEWWKKEAEAADFIGKDILPAFTARLADFAETSRGLSAISAEATVEEMIEGARGLLQSVRKMCKAGEEVQDIISHGKSAEKEIQQYIAALKLIESQSSKDS